MKTTFCTLLILVLALSFSVAAASSEDSNGYNATYETEANILAEIGLLRGSNGNFNLDSSVTHLDAAVMFVRMLGKEAALTNESYTLTFTDVPQWSTGYVGYLTNNGMITGIDATTFGATATCSAQEFAAMMLVSLDYSVKEKDFTAETALDKLVLLGVISNSYKTYLTENTFLRDDMVHLTYSTVFAFSKTKEVSLLRQLVESSAIKLGKAQPYLQAADVASAHVKTGPTGPAGPKGSRGSSGPKGEDGVVDYSAELAPSYVSGQMVRYEGVLYFVISTPAEGTPNSSSSYTTLEKLLDAIEDARAEAELANSRIDNIA